jgi:hypothetical protein
MSAASRPGDCARSWAARIGLEITKQGRKQLEQQSGQWELLASAVAQVLAGFHSTRNQLLEGARGASITPGALRDALRD